jgi:1,4-dihydroxy-2-naphthoyl-CoA synthase
MESKRKVPGYTPVFTKYKNITYEKDGYVVKITLNRPEKRNPLDRAVTLPELNDAISNAEWDDDVKVIIFKGAGDANHR